MREHLQVRQIPGEKRRRWFSSSNFDLIVWHNEDGSFAGFELCYDKMHRERAIIWQPEHGFLHAAIDDGEHQAGRYKSAPIHIADGHFDAQHIHDSFLKESRQLPEDIVRYIAQTIRNHPAFSLPPAPY